MFLPALSILASGVSDGMKPLQSIHIQPTLRQRLPLGVDSRIYTAWNRPIFLPLLSTMAGFGQFTCAL